MTLGVTLMTIELGSRTRCFATAILIAAAGCSSQATPADSPPTSHEGMKDNKGIAPPGTSTERPASNPQVLEGTNRYKAQKIYLRALDIFDQHEYDLALLEFSRALDVDPNYYLAWFKKGLCHYYKQRYDLEIDCYRRCLEIQPDFMEALQSLGAAYVAQDQLERAVPIYRRMLVLDPTHPVALFNIAICYFDLQDYPACIEHLRRFIDAHPQDGSRSKADELLRRARQKLESRETNGAER